MNTLFLVVFVVWIGSEITLSSIMREKRTAESNSDRNTLRIIWIVTVSANLVAAIVTYLTRIPIGPVAELRYAGIAVMAIGVVLRICAIASLRRMFTYNVAIREGHTLNTSGLYHFIRHPSYTGMLITFSGYGLALNNWLGFAIAFLPVFVVMRRRIAVEEAVLLKHFGDTYVTYMRRSWRLVPLIY